MRMGNVARSSVSGYESQFFDMSQGSIPVYGYDGHASGLKVSHKKPLFRRVQYQVDRVGPVGIHRIHRRNPSVLMDLIGADLTEIPVNGVKPVLGPVQAEVGGIHLPL